MKTFRQKYKERKEQGLCVDCGKKAMEGLTRCKECSEGTAKYQTRRLKRMKQIKSLRKYYIKHYGRNLLNMIDPIDKMSYPVFVFCLDCLNFKKCGGLRWLDCPIRDEALKIIRGK